MTKKELKAHLETCHLLIEAILNSVQSAEAKLSKRKFQASVKELEKRIQAYNKIPK